MDTFIINSRFQECDECRVKLGHPTLCSDCVERLTERETTGKTRFPRICSEEARLTAMEFDLEMTTAMLRAFQTVRERSQRKAELPAIDPPSAWDRIGDDLDG